MNRFAMFTDYFVPQLNGIDVAELWFKQDGETCHTARCIINLLRETFDEHIILRIGPVKWPIYDLTPKKSLVYVDKPQTLDNLEANFSRVIANIWPQLVDKVIDN